MAINRYTFSTRRKNLLGQNIISNSRASYVIYSVVESGAINYGVKILEEGERLDTIAGQTYDDASLWWVIAAASGIRWSFGIGCGSGIDPNNYKSDTVIFIPNLEDVINLKKRR